MSPGSAGLSPEDQARLLRDMGVPPDKIQRTLTIAPAYGITAAPETRITPIGDLRTVALPFELTLPWSALCSDNFKSKASIVRIGEKIVPRKVLTARYQAAFKKARELAEEAVRGAEPTRGRLALVARVYPPDERTHDIVNFSKCCCDALARVVFRDDAQMWDARWLRYPADVDRPRAEILITRLDPT